MFESLIEEAVKKAYNDAAGIYNRAIKDSMEAVSVELKDLPDYRKKVTEAIRKKLYRLK